MTDYLGGLLKIITTILKNLQGSFKDAVNSNTYYVISLRTFARILQDYVVSLRIFPRIFQDP